ncbi:penicillin acylase family protein [Rivibacter subsaxonicus]|uniref:Acyl-homoserine-lactone acylase n=1 Tax=Rivibacter subsaxonicus TaxID=457575 RepID=A0A4Q7W0N4_9BURK|nr:penicillin acylase family protein [Rivibacter subsaxonicus]RZU02782.1 acyl-homoserine-lactone acylase [Rivibacter subsaxonicus]
MSSSMASLRRGALALALAGAGLLLAACSNSDSDPAPPPASYSATIRYTSFGVPHVKADNFKGAGYGYGYAFARDNICTFAEEIVTLHGERSKVFGEAGGYLGQLGDQWDNISSDFFYKLLFTPALAARVKAASGQDSQDITAGFVAGYNRYLREVGAAGLPAECKGADWVVPMTEDDAYLRYMQAAMAGSSMAFIRSIGSAQPPGVVVATRTPKARATQLAQNAKAAKPLTLAALQNSSIATSLKVIQEHVIGSNGVALGKDATESGAGIVLGNPHFPWWGTLRLNQVHMTVASAGYDVYGATLLGVPLPLIGFNSTLAWTHTFSTDNRFTLRVLTLDPTDATRYVKDGVSKPLTAVPLTISAKRSDGSLHDITRTLYLSEFGPMLADADFAWSAGSAFAIQDANYVNYKLIDQVILNGKATDVDSLRTAAATYVAMPWVNTMAADKAGKTLYGNFSVAANVADAQIAGCVPGAPYPFQDLMNSIGLVVMTGSTSLCDWAGGVGAAQRPWVTRSDYILNANDSHWWPQATTFLSGYPKIIATGPDAEAMVQGERTRNGHAMVRDRLAGADGLAGNKFNVANLQQLYLQGRFFRAEKWVPEFVAACLASATASAAAKDACSVLQGWNLRHGMLSSGAILFREFYERLGELRDPKWWAVPYSVSDPLETPRGAASTAAALVELEALVLTRQFDTALKRRARPIDSQLVIRGGVPQPIPGGRYTFNNWRGQKTEFPPLSGNFAYLADPLNNQGAYGNSYMQFVTWDASGPVAEGMLTYGQSSHASSEHFNDLTRLYSAGQWAKLPYTDAQITADPNYRVVTISE